MNTTDISSIFKFYLNEETQDIKRCAVGIGNQVYIVECENGRYIFRCSIEKDAYKDTVYWLKKLVDLGIPVPKVLFCGEYESYAFLILDYIEGNDIGMVYENLTTAEKRQIAKEVIQIQRQVSALPLDKEMPQWTWYDFLNEMLDRAEIRIVQNGYFDKKSVVELRKQIPLLNDYFLGIKPIAYLDDISTKNLLIHNGKLAGIIDVDWMGIGDNLTFIAMTYVALRNMGCKTDYVDFLLEERGINEIEYKAFLFYCLLFCVDFMGERGMQFGDKTVEVNENVVKRFNALYEELWDRWIHAV